MKWFKHDSNASFNAKMRKLILRHGTDGYAVYFHSLELICYEIDASKITFELEHDAEIIAENLRIKSDVNLSAVEKVEAIMRTIISLELFENSGEKITCLKLAYRIENSIIKSRELKEIQEKIRDNPGNSRPDKNRIDKNRIDKNNSNEGDSNESDSNFVSENGDTNGKKPRFIHPTDPAFMEPELIDCWTEVRGAENLQTCIEDGTFFIELNKIYDHYSANGWRIGGKTPIKDFKATLRNWLRRAGEFQARGKK